MSYAEWAIWRTRSICKSLAIFPRIFEPETAILMPAQHPEQLRDEGIRSGTLYSICSTGQDAQVLLRDMRCP